MKKILLLPFALALPLALATPAFSAPKTAPAPAPDSFTARLETMRKDLADQFSLQVTTWRFLDTDAPGAEQPAFNDRPWRAIAPGFSWTNTRSSLTPTWLRATITIPPTIKNLPTAQMPAHLSLQMANPPDPLNGVSTDLFINGRLHDALAGQRRYTIDPQWLTAGKFTVALKAPAKPGKFELRAARLYFNPLPELDTYLDSLAFVNSLADTNALPASEKTAVRQALAASQKSITLAKITPDTLPAARAQIAAAQKQLLPIATIAKKHDLYYIGHGHIDMNWKWGWEETIDVAHRTWDSVMHLMDLYPDFNYPQSQPAIYAPIEERFPAQFARIKTKIASGQWNLVGGLWTESDTELPSGEALARAFLLGQHYFKEKFGAHATTGWLPDDFGHTWQLPQIMRLSGIDTFYHMRAGNGMQFTWWQSPDGSRVLKAWTRGYQDQPDLAQMTLPVENNSLLGIPKGLVLYGVGDHGGGPTREQILRIKTFQQNPIYPRVHLVTPDALFRALADDPATPTLPVIDEPLQYVFTGCYTTHANMKKMLRHGENALYTTEVISTLASLAGAGEPYPLRALTDAWKPLVFSQFHDIAPGSAIRSTYTWTAEQLAPTFAFAQNQTTAALTALAALADTRPPAASPAETAIVVWNPLGFERDDIVRATIPNAAQYRSVLDTENHLHPAQPDGPNTLVFIARAVPPFAHRVYFPQKTPAAAAEKNGEAVSSYSPGLPERSAGYPGSQDNNTPNLEEVASPSPTPSPTLATTDTPAAITLQTPSFTLQIDKKTGALTRFHLNETNWEIFAPRDAAANAFQLLGDTGSAWSIKYTGEEKTLATPDAKVRLLAKGPVFARVRVERASGKTTFTQDITVYAALPRVDIPTTVDWHEKETLLKIRLPLNITNPFAHAQTPFAAIERPVTAQEFPAQKWVDLAQKDGAPAPATPVDLSAAFNADSAADFAGSASHLPTGPHRLGPDKIEFHLAEKSRPGAPNTVKASGQKIPLPKHTTAAAPDTLYLLGASAKGNQKTFLTFQFADGTIERRAFNLNQWKGEHGGSAKNTSTYVENTPALQPGPAQLWIVELRLPKNATHIILPKNPNIRLFAATIATKPTAVAHGLSVLNDGKYGYDIQNNTLRLTALRTSEKPDLNTEQGVHQFTYSLYPHANDWRAARTDEQALSLNIPLLVTVATPHPPAPAPRPLPVIRLTTTAPKGNLIITALKQAEDGNGYILRFYEANGEDTTARLDFDRPVDVQETNLLEDPLPQPAPAHPLTQTPDARALTLPVGHHQIITLRVVPK